MKIKILIDKNLVEDEFLIKMLIMEHYGGEIDLAAEIGEEHHKSCLRLYEMLEIEGKEIFEKNGLLEKCNPVKLLQPIVTHFTDIEEYEKCAFLNKIINSF